MSGKNWQEDFILPSGWKDRPSREKKGLEWKGILTRLGPRCSFKGAEEKQSVNPTCCNLTRKERKDLRLEKKSEAIKGEESV